MYNNFDITISDASFMTLSLKAGPFFMEKNVSQPFRLFKFTVLCTVLFSLAAHGYRFLSLGFSGDSMFISQTEDALYQVSLGRFLQPLYWLIRGPITAPLTCGLFTTAFLAASSFLIVLLFGFKKPLQIILTCGLLTANETMAVSGAAYLPWMDVYALSLLLNTLGVYVFFRIRHGVFLSPFLLAASLCLYQSYLPTSSTLVILLLLQQMLAGKATRSVWIDGIRFCAVLVASLLIYALALKSILQISGIQADQNYNGVGRVALPALSQIPQMLISTYQTPLTVLFSLSDTPAMTWHVSAVPAPLNILCFLAALPLLAARLRRRRPGVWMTALFLIAVLPLSVNFIEFISQGTSSGLTIYAYNLLYLLPLLLLPENAAPVHRVHLLGTLSCAALAFVLVLNIHHSNQMALKRDLEYSATTSAVSRILDRAQTTDGYIPGETPVVIIGFLPSSSLAMERPGFESIARTQGMRYTYAAAYETSTYWYLQMALGEPLNLVSHDERSRLTEQALQDGIPSYPDPGCCRMQDGYLFLRLN